MAVEELRLHLGCGNDIRAGYINIDKYDEAAQVKADACDLPYEDNSVDEIVSFQMIEHLPYWQTSVITSGMALFHEPIFFQECYRVLKPGGTMITECPDLEWIANRIVESGDIDYISTINLWGEYYRPWDKDRFPDWQHHAGGLHINGFTWGKIQKIADHVGFTVEQQEMEAKDKRYRYPENLSVKWTKP